MPICLKGEVIQMTKHEVCDIAYSVMGVVFDIHRELGVLFDEIVYKKALMKRVNQSQSEVEIEVSLHDFTKSFYIDMIASKGAIFELKAVDSLNASHEGQLLNYLLLTDMNHGKLVNMRPGSVEHKFVNNALPRARRICFTVEDSAWRSTPGFGMAEKTLVEEMVRDWGTALSRSLYEEAIVHFLGGPETVFGWTQVTLDGVLIARQPMLLCACGIGLKITAFNDNMTGYYNNLKKCLHKTNLQAIQWINIGLDKVQYVTII